MHILIAALHRPAKPTGVCRHAANLALCLAHSDSVTHVTLVVGAWQDYYETAFSLASPKIKVLYISIKNNSLTRNQWFLFGLPRLAKDLQPDLIHLAFPIPFIRAAFAVPVASTLHDFYPYEYPENFGYPRVLFNRLFLQQCIANSDGLSCVSQTTLTALKHYFPGVGDRKIIDVIYNSVDFSTIVPRTPEFIPANAVEQFILCVGQHRKNKNLDLLIRAFGMLLELGQLPGSSHLVIVGSSGPETPYLAELIRQQSLEQRVLLVAALDDSELCWLYQHCDLFVIPSSTEGFCLPLAEALYLSCNVVCSSIPIFQEIGSATCTYFELSGDAARNLMQAMGQALADSTRTHQRDERFSLQNVAEKYLNFYQKLHQLSV